MKWENVKLGAFVEKIGSGSTPKGGSMVYVDCGVTFIRSQNIYNLSFSEAGLTYINDMAAQKLSSVEIHENDILLNITGDSVARTCIVPRNILPARVNQHVCIIRVNQELLNAKYLVYYLASPYMQAFMLNLAVGKGASRNALTKSMIENFDIPLPPLSVQQRIASILSTYDDLIENNQKQIKLLEEAAQRLYKEWFVDLHFPGYEDVKIVDGVPEGWKKTILDNVICFNPSIKLNQERIKEVVPMSALNTSSMVLDCRKFEKSTSNSGSKFQNTDTLVARITPCLENGKIAYVNNIASEEGTVGSTEFIVMRGKKINPYMVYLLARTEHFRLSAARTMKGSDGRQRAQVDKIKQFLYIMPNQKIIEEFEELVKPFFDKCYLLNESNMVLQEARDRLLPKLMNGEIDI